MFHVKEFDEDPALLYAEELDGPAHLFAVNTSIPRREYKLDFATAGSSSTNSSTSHVITTTPLTTTTTHSTTASFVAFFRTPKQILVDLFLPLGFPHSVDASYLLYQIYDSLQGLCSYLRGVVSTSAVLTAAGVGNADATALGAAMTWALKDGLGMMGGLLFSYVASPQFDAYVLEFRLFADLINDVGLLLDMMAPLVPSRCLLFLMSCSTLSKTMCGMSAGATKSSITVHLAKEGNMADLNAKEGTQETLVSLVGMMLGVQLAHYLEHLQRVYHDRPITIALLGTSWHVPMDFAVSWAIFLFLTWLHMWANYRGVKLLKLTTLNRERAHCALRDLVTVLAHHYFQHPTTTTSINLDSETTIKTIKRPHDVDESMLRATATLIFPRQQPVALGVSLLETLSGSTKTSDPRILLQEFDQEKYILAVHLSSKSIGGSNNNQQVVATLRTGADNNDELKAFVHCMVVRQCLDLAASDKQYHAVIDGDWTGLIQITHAQLKGLFDTTTDNSHHDSGNRSRLMEKLSQQGWDVDSRLYLGFGRRRTSWETKSQ